MEAVRVLHREFARTKHAKLRTFLIAELRLNLIERQRELTIARNVLRNEARDLLFVRRAEDDGSFSAAANKSRLNQDVAESLDAVRLFIKRLRTQRRHKELDRAAFIHFVAHNIDRLVKRAPTERKISVRSRHNLRNHTRAEHENMAWNLCPVRGFLHRWNKCLRPFHSDVSQSIMCKRNRCVVPPRISEIRQYIILTTFFFPRGFVKATLSKRSRKIKNDAFRTKTSLILLP